MHSTVALVKMRDSHGGVTAVIVGSGGMVVVVIMREGNSAANKLATVQEY